MSDHPWYTQQDRDERWQQDEEEWLLREKERLANEALKKLEERWDACRHQG